MLPFLFFTSRSKRVSFCPHTWQVKVNGIFASRAIKTRHAGSALKKVYHKGSETAAGDAPSPVTNIVSIGHAAIFHNGKMRLFAAPCHFPSCYAASQGSPRPLSFFARLAKRRCEITILSFSRSICHGGLAALTGVTGEPYPSCLSCHSHPIRPCGHLPLEGKAAIREYHLLKKAAKPTPQP